MSRAEEEGGRFDMRIALKVLEHEATYRAAGATPQGLFSTALKRSLAIDSTMYMDSMPWQTMIFSTRHVCTWIRIVSRQVGLVDLADLVFVRSREYWRLESRAALLAGNEEPMPDRTILFGEKEGRIARANRGKDPMFFFPHCKGNSPIQAFLALLQQLTQVNHLRACPPHRPHRCPYQTA